MKKISLSGGTGYIKKHIDFLFLGILVILVVFDLLAIKTSLGLITQVNSTKDEVKQNKDVRVNFAAYDAAVKRLEEGQVYQANNVITDNPFKPLVKASGK